MNFYFVMVFAGEAFNGLVPANKLAAVLRCESQDIVEGLREAVKVNVFGCRHVGAVTYKLPNADDLARFWPMATVIPVTVTPSSQQPDARLFNSVELKHTRAQFQVSAPVDSGPGRGEPAIIRNRDQAPSQEPMVIWSNENGATVAYLNPGFNRDLCEAKTTARAPVVEVDSQLSDLAVVIATDANGKVWVVPVGSRAMAMFGSVARSVDKETASAMTKALDSLVVRV